MVALILSGVIAISLTSFLTLTTHASKMANRSFYMDAAQDLCDAGLDMTLWAMNNSDWTDAGFTSSATNQYQGTFPSSGSYQFSGGVTGTVKIWVDNTDSTKPHTVVKATVTLIDGSQITKEAEAYMKQSSYFDDGLVAGSVSFSGSNVTVNSWNSNPTGNAVVHYSSSVAAANVTVGATNVTPGALGDQNGKIYGDAAAGSTDTGGGITINQGVIGDTSYVNTTSNKGSIQDGHATYDFTESFPDVTAPSAPGNYTVKSISGDNITLPGGTDTPASDGYYYYSASSISLGGNSDELHITSGKVRILMSSTGSSLSTGGSAPGIVIDSGASLQIYTAGNVSISGNGVVNGSTSLSSTGQPINFQLYGTRSTSQVATSGYQSISISGNGYFSGVIYAPNGNVTMNGGGSSGDVLGAIVAHSATLNGGTSFHYDESLPNTLTTGLWKLRKWRELVSDADRSPYNSYLSF